MVWCIDIKVSRIGLRKRTFLKDAETNVVHYSGNSIAK